MTTRATQPALLEREAELSTLRAAVDAGLSGTGTTAVVEGPAGAGKSALLAAAADDAQGRARVLRATGAELERKHAFGAIRQLFQPLLAVKQLRQRLLAGDAAPAEWAIDPDREPDVSLARAGAGFAVLYAIYWLVVNLVGDMPLVLSVDDLQWVDDSSLHALDFLARRLADLPVVLLVAVRPSEPVASALVDVIRTVPGAARVTPPPLSATAVATLVRQHVPDASDDVCGAFYEGSGGNPLYLRELLLSTVATGLVSAPDAAEAVRRAAVPGLAERLARRIGGVAPEAEGLATAMAVLGDGAPLRIAAELAGVDYDAAARIARRLSEIEVLAAEDPVGFAHPVIRRSLYDRPSVADREELHLRAVGLLREAGATPDAIATHVSALPPTGSSSSARLLVEAAHLALARAAPGSAITLLERALAERAPEPEAAELLYELGGAKTIVRDASALADLREAFETAHRTGLRGRAAVALADTLAVVGQGDEALAVLTRASAELGERDPEVVVELEGLRAMTAMLDPRHVDDFERDRARLEGLTERDGWAPRALAALLANAAVLRSEPNGRVMELVERALRGGRLLTERAGAWGAPNLLAALVFADQHARALTLSRELVAEGRRTGSLLAIMTGIGARGGVLARTGELVAAEADLHTVVQLARETEMRLWIATALHLFADVLIERPQLADVAGLVDAIEMDPGFATTVGGAEIASIRGRIAIETGERERGLADLRASAAVLESLRFGASHSAWRSDMALAMPPHERDRAQALVADELELARRSGLARPEGIALRSAGVLEGGRRGVELLRESVAKLEASPARLEHARSLVELGAALDGGGDRAEARGILTAGLDLAGRCGADRLAARADRELRAAGARPRRSARSGVPALTASELRVARLAAEGRSNVEIAQELYVTIKTVETHLSNAYAKLGLSGRGARDRLARVLD